jgi:hypothetical protein
VINPNLAITGEKQIVAAECFFDTDPGVGNGIPCQCADGGCDEPEEEIECKDIDISSLPTGMHRLYFRTRDSENQWGITRSYTIQTYEPPTLIAGEYFIDNDPGEGKGTAILFPKDFFWDEAQEAIELSIDASGYASGAHFMFVRMKDNRGWWGLPDCQPFGENPCEGDFDSDGDVDGSDLSIFASDFGRTNCDQGETCEGDFDSDNDVDGSDLALFAADFGKTGCPTCP